MLRTLLNKLSRQAEPEMIAKIAPESWEALCLFDKDPRPCSEDSLHKMLSRTLYCMSIEKKTCIFIDGLGDFKASTANWLSFSGIPYVHTQ